jgi:GNAT superfamily N-acetyltransferase
MGWRLSDAVEEFLSVAGEFLRAERARNTIALTVTEALRRDPSLYSSPLFGWYSGAGEPGAGEPGAGQLSAAFMQTPPFPAFLTAMTEPVAAALAAELAATRPDLPGVNAEDDAAWAFAGVWRERTGREAEVKRRSRLFRLGELSWPSPRPDGAARLATAADRDLLLAWMEAFDDDVGERTAQDHSRAIDSRISYGGFTIWEVAGVPVSMAGVTRAADGMIRVGPVYTLPEQRGRGYGGAATSVVSQAALDAGIAEVLLYTDLANPTSNALYRRLGYRPVEDRILLAFG